MLREHLTQNVIPMKFKELLAEKSGQGSTVGTATDYGLDSPGFDSQWGKRSLCQNLSTTSPGAHAATCSMGAGTVPRGKVARAQH
jgi:hypothetical protein